MTFKELKKLYPDEKSWFPMRVWPNGSYSPNWNYKEDDIILEFKETSQESIEITKALLGHGKNGKRVESKVEIKWVRR